MDLTAVSPGLFPTALMRDTVATPTGDTATAASRLPDVVVFSSAPFRLLADLATAGLRQLATLLPSIEQAVEDRSQIPLGHLAKAANAAARQVGDGHVALLAAGPDRTVAALPNTGLPRSSAPDSLRAFARQQGNTPDEPAPARPDDTLRVIARQLGAALPLPQVDKDAEGDPAQRWLSEAKHLLRRTSDVLGDAIEIRPTLDPAAPLSPQANWAMAEMVAARAQIAATVRQLDEVPPAAHRSATPAVFPTALRLDRLTGATSALGIVLLLALLAMAVGLWSGAMGILALGGTAYWAWRIGRATQGFRLDGAP